MGKSSDNEYIFHVHIVNSVKGGSGKSTFSLLLANYFSRQNLDAYVIDLDMCGTSWYSDYEKCWNNPIFINDIMYSPRQNGFRENVWSKLKVTDKDGERILNVCLAAKDQSDEICDMPEVELLENTTFQLIEDTITINKNRIEQKKKKSEELLPYFKIILKSYKVSQFLDAINEIIKDTQRVGDPTQSNENWQKVLEQTEKIKSGVQKLSHSLFYILKNILNDDKKTSLALDNETVTDILKSKQLIVKIIDCINILKRHEPDEIKTLEDDSKNEILSVCQTISNILEQPIDGEWLELNKNIDESFENCYQDVKSYLEDKKRTNLVKSIENDETAIDYQRYISRTNLSTINFILDLPPSHEATVEQICHHLLFDNNSPLNVKYSDKFKVSLYIMTPVDQPSALKKNIAYLTNLMDNKRRYSSTINAFKDTGRLKNCFVIIDNHNWLETKGIPKTADDYEVESNKLITIENSTAHFLPFIQFAFKKDVNVFPSKDTKPEKSDTKVLDLSNVENNKYISNIVEATK